METHSVAMYI